MPDKRIVYTRPDGGVSVCAPSLTAMAYMTGGGGRWDDILPTDPEFLDRQIAEQSKHGVGEGAASRFVRAMQFGGLTTAEAYGVMRDRYCAHLGTGCELWDTEDVPTDRWFRNAWRRSHNGGPIHVSLEAARPIQATHIERAVKMENARRATFWSRWVKRLAALDVDWGALADAIRHARDEEELRRIWPEGLALTSPSAELTTPH